eukprot:TRINITY_DN2770_c0_g2_i3.p2 TRINITY_DN2770_c0_g2~~TRINITY_DN2770_c0_g2_i3.p2  ORF type:complete len:210 (-),score=35.35 TRINITY_DN2770_c0_g2_i3:109-738(-)
MIEKEAMAMEGIDYTHAGNAGGLRHMEDQIQGLPINDDSVIKGTHPPQKIIPITVIAPKNVIMQYTKQNRVGKDEEDFFDHKINLRKVMLHVRVFNAEQCSNKEGDLMNCVRCSNFLIMIIDLANPLASFNNIREHAWPAVLEAGMACDRLIMLGGRRWGDDVSPTLRSEIEKFKTENNLLYFETATFDQPSLRRSIEQILWSTCPSLL